MWPVLCPSVQVGAELRKYGLRYEDVIVVTPDVDTAIRRMEVEDPAAVELRNKRLKRAMDLGLKHTYMPAEMQAAHDPWADSMTRYIAEAKRERLEAQGVFAERPPKSDSPAFFTR